MDSKEYKEKSARTLSDQFHTELVHGNEVYQLIHAIKAVGRWADDVKRALYYGKEYKTRTAKDHRQITDLAPYKDYLHGILGEVTEIAEIAEHFSEVAFEGKPFDRVNAIEEEGDRTFYSACRWRFLDVTPEDDIYGPNINKLRIRYPERFTSERALTRDLGAERRSLEADLGKNDPKA